MFARKATVKGSAATSIRELKTNLDSRSSQMVFQAATRRILALDAPEFEGDQADRVCNGKTRANPTSPNEANRDRVHWDEQPNGIRRHRNEAIVKKIAFSRGKRRMKSRSAKRSQPSKAVRQGEIGKHENYETKPFFGQLPFCGLSQIEPRRNNQSSLKTISSRFQRLEPTEWAGRVRIVGVDKPSPRSIVFDSVPEESSL